MKKQYKKVAEPLTLNGQAFDVGDRVKFEFDDFDRNGKPKTFTFTDHIKQNAKGQLLFVFYSEEPVNALIETGQIYNLRKIQ